MKYLLKMLLGKVQIGSNIAQNTYCLYDVISGHKQLTKFLTFDQVEVGLNLIKSIFKHPGRTL